MTADIRCALFGSPDRPAVCSSLRPSVDMCGDSAAAAMAILIRLEALTAPRQGRRLQDLSMPDGGMAPQPGSELGGVKRLVEAHEQIVDLADEPATARVIADSVQ